MSSRTSKMKMVLIETWSKSKDRRIMRYNIWVTGLLLNREKKIAYAMNEVKKIRERAYGINADVEYRHHVGNQ